MKVAYHKWWSPALGQDMELKVYGETGKPVLVFPCQGGRFFEFEDFGMVAACEWLIDSGDYQVITIDSIDYQSWCNGQAHPADRARRHNDYDRYVVAEVIPFIRDNCHWDAPIATTGCSMGGYHSANFFFRHPDVFDSLIAVSGLFQMRLFIGDYMDDGVYFNTPLAYLPGIEDPWYLDRYRRSRIIVVLGQGAWEEDCIKDARELKQILERKEIPAWIDFWGNDVNHDWPWWRKMIPYHLDRLRNSQ